METLVALEHKNQYYIRIKQHGPGRICPSPSKTFRAINCRTFQSGSGGILPTLHPSPRVSSPKTPTPISKLDSKSKSKSTASKNVKKEKPFSDQGFEGFSLSELWAGPAYSNSPPPSSLPMPKFSARPKRTVSLELPRSGSDVEMHRVAHRSAPPSPTRERRSSEKDVFLCNADESATRTLRRILNLDVEDE